MISQRLSPGLFTHRASARCTKGGAVAINVIARLKGIINISGNVQRREPEGLTIKIAIFHMGFMYSGGGERTAIYESILLGRRGHEVSCFAPAIRPDVCYPELMRKINLRGFIPRVKINLPLRDFLSLSASSFLTPAISRKFKGFDAILCHGQPATWIGYQVSMRLGKKYFCYLHQPARFLYPREIDKKVCWKTKKDLAILIHPREILLG